MSNKQQFEREFEEFLNEEDSKLAALYRKLPRPEPDAKLDAAVAAMARRAAAASTPARTRAPRWVPALSAAAVVALAAGIAFRLGPTVWQQRNVEPLPRSENAVSAGATVKEQDTDMFKDKAAQKPAPLPAEPISRSASAPAAASPAAPPAAPPAAKVPAPAPLRKAETAAKRVDAPMPQAFPLQVEQEKKSMQPGGAGAQAQGELNEQAAERQRDERAQTTATPMAAPAREEAAAPPPPAPTGAPPPAQEPPMNSAAADSALAAPAPAAKAAHLAPLRSKDPNARLYPEHWLQNIRTMLREGKRDEALRSLAEFRKMYPDYHLPDDLRDLK